ncbi:hypothetical protein FNF27_02205 [Cafeteria roenbergensis]|uniref:Uncharacterized protein n=1 Tax=Cafeteria roenbergensis TaxID=33653 RepID=A0A5A8EFW6_CAFRO|nr:hypothetical protein FNF27_02205 [Cafeteria roenbergensis]
MAAIKGLRSADNEDIVKLLGRLGTASMELAHCTDIDAVLQHARVTLEMPGGEAQLAKWHRLGHLQSVAGRFAEVMAKPSALATVQTHADSLLARAEKQAEKQAEKEKREAEEQAAKEKREAEEQAAARESRGKVLARLDKAIGVVHKDLLEATAAQLPERGDQSVEDFVFAQMQPPGGLSAAVRMAGSSPKELSVVPQAVEQPWWLLWPGSEARKWLASRMAGDIAALTQPTNRLGETNGRAVFGPRGVGKTSMLAAGAVAAGVFSSIPSLPEGSRRIVPVYLNMGHAAYLYESAAKHGTGPVVLAILLSAEANVELPYEQRVHLRYPTIGSTTTEPAMAGAFAKRGQQSTVFVNGAGHQPSAELKASLWKSMRALGRTDSHGLPAIEQVKWPKKGEGNFADWKLDSFLGPPRPIVALTS